MTVSYLVMFLVNVLILLLGVSVGRSIMLIKVRKEENRKRELELSLLEKRAEVIVQGKQVANNIEDLLYRAHVQQEIEKILRKNGLS